MNLHHVKFYNWAPRSIQCMAFNASSSKLALARYIRFPNGSGLFLYPFLLITYFRSNATIEIWDLRTAPYMERSIVSGSLGSIEAVSWLGNELLTAGLAGKISCWDLAKLQVKETLMVTGSSVWCLDVCLNTIAAGTEEGYLNICEYVPDDIPTLKYVKILDKQDGRILCCKFDKTGSHIVTGSVDLLRIWDVCSGHVVHKISTGRSDVKKETVIWSILVLKDLQIATADSRGRLTLWDGKIGSQLESYQCLRGDALCLAVDAKEETIFVSGIEPTICSYTLTNIKKDSKELKKWIRTTSYYSHTHDVKALIIHDNNLISGGIDGQLCLTSLSSKLYLQNASVPLKPPAVVTDNRLILLKYENYLELWRLGTPGNLRNYPVKLLELLSRDKKPFMCASISPNGMWLSYSTASHIGLFILQLRNPSKPELQTIKSHLDQFSPAAISVFSPSSQQLYLYKPASAEISVFALLEDNEDIDFQQNISLVKCKLNIFTPVCASLIIACILIFLDTSDLVHLIEISNCEKFLVIASLCNNVVIFAKHEKKVAGRSLMEWRHHTTLPKYNFPAVTLTIHPKTRILTVSYANHKLIDYNMDDLQFIHSACLGLTGRYHINQQVICDPRRDDRLFILNGKELLSIIKSEVNTVSTEAINDDPWNGDVIKRPKKKGNDVQLVSSFPSNWSVKIIKEAYVSSNINVGFLYSFDASLQHMVFAAWLGQDELLAIEINAQSVSEQLPPAMILKKYGSG